MDLNIADLFIIITIAISTLVGIYRGFIREFLTIVTWIIASFVAYIYGKNVGEYFFFVDSANTKELLGMCAVFIGVVFLGFLLKLIICKMAKISGVSSVDRLTGALFGALRGCLLIILVIFASSKNITNQDWYKKSQLMPRFTKVADVIADATPKTWKEDFKHEVDDVMTKEQAPAPVTAAKPDMVKDTGAKPVVAPAAPVAPAATVAPATSTTTTKPAAATPTVTKPSN